MVTAISPRALVDVILSPLRRCVFVRRISEIYGGRPGFFGFLKLIRSVGAHLAITGGVAIGDSLIQQVVGHGIAAKLSARLGEGVLNGMLTAARRPVGDGCLPARCRSRSNRRRASAMSRRFSFSPTRKPRKITRKS